MFMICPFATGVRRNLEYYYQPPRAHDEYEIRCCQLGKLLVVASAAYGSSYIKMSFLTLLTPSALRSFEEYS